MDISGPIFPEMSYPKIVAMIRLIFHVWIQVSWAGFINRNQTTVHTICLCSVPLFLASNLSAPLTFHLSLLEEHRHLSGKVYLRKVTYTTDIIPIDNLRKSEWNYSMALLKALLKIKMYWKYNKALLKAHNFIPLFVFWSCVCTGRYRCVKLA